MHDEVFKTYKKTNGMMADMHKIISNHIYITMSQPLLRLLRLPPLLLYHYYYYHNY